MLWGVLKLREFVNRVDEILKQKGLLRIDVVRATGIGESRFRRWMGDSVPAADTALKIAQYLGVSVEYLLEGDNTYTVDPDCGKLIVSNQMLDDIHRLSKDDQELVENLIKRLSQ